MDHEKRDAADLIGEMDASCPQVVGLPCRLCAYVTHDENGDETVEVRLILLGNAEMEKLDATYGGTFQCRVSHDPDGNPVIEWVTRGLEQAKSVFAALIDLAVQVNQTYIWARDSEGPDHGEVHMSDLSQRHPESNTIEKVVETEVEDAVKSVEVLRGLHNAPKQ